MHPAATVIGVDIGGSGVKAAVVDTSTGRLLTERIRQATPQPATPDAVGLVVAGLVAQLATEVHGSSPVGCTVPSVVRNGVVLTAANIDPGWIGDHTAERLGRLLSRPVTVLNDADAAGVAEVRFGAARDVAGTVLVLTLGTGIGSALFRDGVLVPNTELGHAEFHGAAAEKYAAASVRKAQGLSWTEWARRLSALLRHYSLLVAPDLIVLGGGVSRRADSFMPKLEVEVPVAVAGLGNAAGVVGAAMLAAEQGGAPQATGAARR